MSQTVRYDAAALKETMEERVDQYKEFRGNLFVLKRKMVAVTDLGEAFEGLAAGRIKDFFRAQSDVAEVWIQFVDQQIAFMNDVGAMAEDRELGGSTVIDVPVLDEELQTAHTRLMEMVRNQQQDVADVLSRIQDLISIQAYSSESIEQSIEDSKQKRWDTVETVEEFDAELVREYDQSEETQMLVTGLFEAMMDATSQNGEITPMSFNSSAFEASAPFQVKDEVQERSMQYIQTKQEQAEARDVKGWSDYNPIEAYNKVGQSVQNVTQSIIDGHGQLAEKRNDSWYDFANYWLFGAFDTVKGFNEHVNELTDKQYDSTYDYWNARFLGLPELVKNVFNPQEVYSEQHVTDTLGLITLFAGTKIRPSLPDADLKDAPVSLPQAPLTLVSPRSEMPYLTMMDQWNLLTMSHRFEVQPAGAYGIDAPGPKTTERGLAYSAFRGDNSKIEGVGTLDKSLAKVYLRDIEAKTGRKVNNKQIYFIKENLRHNIYEKLTPIETAKHRSKFTSSLKDKLIAEWEEKTNQIWPRYTEEVLDKNGEVARSIGQPYDAHHIIENNFGGPHEWWNIHPAKYPNEHQAGIHGKGAPSGLLFPRR
ncbi:T7SS effector LXG polymorphic toxin [Jeotgalibacillus sp. ET6]|uniref:T7SS effector LXG polymorphic toxin n=1 Tax=Jeotgalibacillus sp. ET6 TaxID=3037260 RepID=UPI0024188AA5|nr:T7SS effector LXG polymorphic toxin [Jeotgalibacillus sp. ET6]MDG5471377.1 T7SS effector LXG polymorphic toxin [Jeotgalibacillus sp. ET6]